MENIESEKDRMLWKKAKKRVGFKNHLIYYLIVNAFFWLLWFFTCRETEEDKIPWPTFCTLGWGFGLFWHFMGAYVFENKVSQVEKEYRKLKDKSGL